MSTGFRIQPIRGDRLQLPDTYLPGQIVVLAAGPGCLLLFGEQQWNGIRDELFARRQTSDRHVESLLRMLVGAAEQMRVSGRRRISLNEWHRRWSRIERQAIWRSYGSAAELWRPETFSEDVQVLPALLSELGAQGR